MPRTVSEVLPNPQCRCPNSFHGIIISLFFSFQQFYYDDVINIKDRKVYRGVADCFNLVFITCGINLMISAHCTNAATKLDTLCYVLWRKKPWVTPYWKKPQSNKPAAQHIFLVSLSMGGESEGQHLTEHSNNKENKWKLCTSHDFFFPFWTATWLNNGREFCRPLKYGMLILQTSLTQGTNSSPKCSLPLLLPQTGIQMHLPRMSFSYCSLSSQQVRYACQM